MSFRMVISYNLNYDSSVRYSLNNELCNLKFDKIQNIDTLWERKISTFSEEEAIKEFSKIKNEVIKKLENIISRQAVIEIKFYFSKKEAQKTISKS